MSGRGGVGKRLRYREHKCAVHGGGKSNVAIAGQSSFCRLLRAGKTLCCLGASLILLIALGCEERPHERQTPADAVSKAQPRATHEPVAAGSAAEHHALHTNHFAPGLPAADHADAAQTNLIAVWLSPKSTSDERAEAVMEMIPRGASLESAQALLGNDGVLSRSYGPSMNFVPGTNGEIVGETGSHDYWEWEYHTQSGIVALRFSLEPGGQKPRYRFERAYSVRVLKGGSAN